MLAVRTADFRIDGPEYPQISRIHVCAQINLQNERIAIKGKIKEFWATVPREARYEVAPLVRTTESLARLWPLTRAQHNKEWNALRKRLKLPENFVWHSLRHHAATWFLDQGASFEDVAIQLGHSDEGFQVRDTYGHRDRGKALDRLEAIVS
jgi:integrase